MPKQEARILEENAGELIEKCLKLSKRAKKLGCNPLNLHIDFENKHIINVLMNGDHIELDHAAKPINPFYIKRTYVTLDATLEYDVPKYDGWRLISVFDIEPGTDKTDPTVFTSTVPGETLPPEYNHKTSIECQHCNHKRYRTHSMLIEHDNGDRKEVGSTCIKDFLGHDPSAWLFYASISLGGFCREIDDFDQDGCPRSSEVLDIYSVMVFTAMAIRRDGWVSGGEAYMDERKTATRENVSYYMGLEDDKRIEPGDEDRELAAETIEHFENLDPGENDYLNNCVKVVKLGYVPMKMFGTACSMIATFRNIKRERLEKKEYPESNWVGDLKDRIEVTALCAYVREIETDFGVSVLYAMIDEKTGNKFKTFYSGYKWSMEQGETYTFKGTVKKHETYADSKNTVLTRVALQ